MKRMSEHTGLINSYQLLITAACRNTGGNMKGSHSRAADRCSFVPRHRFSQVTSFMRWECYGIILLHSCIPPLPAVSDTLETVSYLHLFKPGIRELSSPLHLNTEEPFTTINTILYRLQYNSIQCLNATILVRLWTTNTYIFPMCELCGASCREQWLSKQWLNTLRLRQNGCHYTDDSLKWTFLNENVWIEIKISPNFVPKGSIKNIPALVQNMVWRQPGDKPLSEPMMVSLLTHICVTRPQLDESTVRRQLKSPQSLPGRSIHLTLVTKWSWS